MTQRQLPNLLLHCLALQSKIGGAGCSTNQRFNSEAVALAVARVTGLTTRALGLRCRGAEEALASEDFRQPELPQGSQRFPAQRQFLD